MLANAARLNETVGAFVPGRLALRPKAPEFKDSPLKGTAIGVKDNIRTADFDSTFGADIPASSEDRFDADIVKTLRSLGAVICGKTSMAEFALFRAPATRNPKAWSRTPGGSSSGSAAAIAAGMVPVAVGTQTAGSVIRPAAFCGVVGFKPTFGALSCRGVQPLAPSLDTLGLFARSVADISRVANPLLGLAPQDDPQELPLRLGYCATWSDISVAQPVKRAFRQALSRLDMRDLTAERIVMPARLSMAHHAHGTVMAYEAVRSLRPWQVQRPVPLSMELQAYLEASAMIADTAYQVALQQFDEARDSFDRVMSQFDAILAPSTQTLPPIGLASTGSSAMNRLWTALHAPVLTLPLQRPGRAVPVGLQVIGARGADIRTLQIARILERALAMHPEKDHGPVPRIRRPDNRRRG